MPRLIDATRIEQYILNNCSDNEEINAIYAEIINAPTVDAVEVVYCKDCKWFDDCECRLEEDVQGIRRTVALKDYCSFGERK